jgi:hypothetical protein
METSQNAAQQFGWKIDVEIADERENRIELSDFGQRDGRLTAQLRPAGQRHMRGQVSIPNALDEIGVGQQG